jgi:hypothetical protein
MLNALRRSVLLRLAVMTLFLAFVGVSWGQASKRPVSSEPQRKQLAMGYTLLYQEADAIPKLKWILTFRKKSDEMARARMMSSVIWRVSCWGSKPSLH